jgi:hypothetical protein
MAGITDEKLLQRVRDFVNDKFDSYAESIAVECETCGLPKESKIKLTDGKATIDLLPQEAINQIKKYMVDNHNVDIIDLMLAKSQL